MKVVHKLFNTKASSIDDESKSVTFIISTNEPDRYGDIVDQKSWNFKSYEDNPLVLWGHDPSEPENVLGQASNLQIAQDGGSTTATLTFATDVNAKAALVWNLITRGVLRTVSVGFRNHSLEYDDDTPILKDNELLEISVVPIPANAGAVAKELKAGNLETKDADWLIKSMNAEVALLEEAKKLTNPVKEKSMTDEQASALINAVADLKKTVEAQNATIEELKAAQTAEEPKEEPKVTDPVEEPKEPPVQTDESKDPAKGGEDDQPGAGEDEFGDDTELTPEQEAELEAAFEEATAELEPAA